MSTTRNADDLPVAVAAIAGLVTWVIGYLCTFLLVSSDIQESGLNQFAQTFGDGDATYELVGWVFFNSHFVDAIIDAGFFGTDTANFIGGDDGFSTLLFLIPPALLVVAGVAVGRYRGVTGLNDGAITGALVLPGYLVLSIVGAFLFRVEASGASGEPALVPAVLLAGIVYPLVFGALGGVLAGVTADDSPT